MHTYATLAEARAELNVNAGVTTDDALIMDLLRQVTERIDAETENTFAPYAGVHTYDTLGQHIDDYANEMYLGRPLLALTEVIDANDAELTLWDGQRSTRAEAGVYAKPLGYTPQWTLVRLNGAGWSFGGSSPFGVGGAGWQDAISVSGVWGWHDRYVNAWQASGDTVLNNPLTAGGTSITVTDADGARPDGYAPRFSPGNLLQIGDEWVSVVAANYTSNTLTVQRAQRGTEADEHAAATPISVYVPMRDIVRACLRWVGFVYQRRGVFTSIIVDTGGGTLATLPADIPEEAANIIALYKANRYSAFVSDG